MYSDGQGQPYFAVCFTKHVEGGQSHLLNVYYKETVAYTCILEPAWGKGLLGCVAMIRIMCKTTTHPPSVAVRNKLSLPRRYHTRETARTESLRTVSTLD